MQLRGTKCRIRTTSCELLVEDRAKPLELVKPVELVQTVMLSPAWKRAPNLDNRALLARGKFAPIQPKSDVCCRFSVFRADKNHALN